mmetsp:Transcript_18063/g.40988  ORF Transcript_18063/g.40988 Transcript_18063/m.40988 type:complete len:248 (+) Transcript_18063:664-1407(+)
MSFELSLHVHNIDNALCEVQGGLQHLQGRARRNKLLNAVFQAQEEGGGEMREDVLAEEDQAVPEAAGPLHGREIAGEHVLNDGEQDVKEDVCAARSDSGEVPWDVLGVASLAQVLLLLAPPVLALRLPCLYPLCEEAHFILLWIMFFPMPRAAQEETVEVRICLLQQPTNRLDGPVVQAVGSRQEGSDVEQLAVVHLVQQRQRSLDQRDCHRNLRLSLIDRPNEHDDNGVKRVFNRAAKLLVEVGED